MPDLEDGFEIDMGMDDANENNKQNEHGQPVIPEGVDPEVWALALAAKKAKEDPQTREVLMRALGVEQPKPAQPEPQVDEDEKRLAEVKRQIDELRARIQLLDPQSEEFARISRQIAELELEAIKLEPKVYVKQALTPLQQQQINLALQTINTYAHNALFNNPRIAHVPEKKRQEIYATVQQAINEVYQRDPQSLLNLQNMQQFVDMVISRLLLDVLLPPPMDQGYNAPSGAIGRKQVDEIPAHVREELKALGIDEEEYKKILREMIEHGEAKAE